MEKKYKVEREFIPINLLIAFLIGLAAAIFIIASRETFKLSNSSQTLLTIFVGVIYLVITFFMLIPKKTKTPIDIPHRITFHHDPQEKPKEVIKIVEKIVEKKVPVPVEKKVTKIVHKKGDAKIAIVHVEKKRKKKSKYMGSMYNEKYHLRTCRFSGAIKKKYLMEENDRKFFKLRGYKACKVCKPNYN